MKALIADLHPYLAISSGLFIFMLVAWVLSSPPRSVSKICFAFTATCMAIYLIGFSVAGVIQNLVWSRWISIISEVFIHQISPSFFVFSVFFLNLKKQKPLAFVAPLFALFVVTPLTVTIPDQSLHSYWWGNFFTAPYQKVSLWLYVFYYLSFYGFSLLAIWNFIVAHQREKNLRKKTHIKYIILAFSIAYLGSLDHLAWMGFEFYPFGYICMSLYTLILAYSFVKHKLLEVNVLLKKASLVLFVYGSLLAVSIPFGFFILQKTNLADAIPSSTVILLGLFFGAILSIGPFLYARLIRANFWLKSQFSEGLTHELKSPLGTIRGGVDALLDQARQDPKTIDVSYLTLIEKNTGRLENYVNDLLSLVSINKGDVRLVKAETDVSKIIDSVLEERKVEARHKDIDFVFKNGDPITAKCDPGKIRQTFSNLISNALKFSKRGKIEINLALTGPNALISVKDSGQGVVPKETERIFDSFYQGANAAKGSGLGLTIAKGWVEAHGGEIWAESEGEGKGTTVSFTLPVKP